MTEPEAGPFRYGCHGEGETSLTGATGKRWTIGRYEFERIPRAESGPGSRGRWGCTWRNQRGIASCRSPFGAFFGLRRALRRTP